MKALVCNKPFEFSYKQLSTPTIKEDQVLLKVAAVGICGTDIHAFGGNQPFFSYPRILGHEASGIIADIGSKVSQWKVGQRVALIPYVSCGECDACRSGRTNCCEKISVIGVHEDGAFSEYLAAPARNILAIDDQVDDITAALIEPFAISAHAVRRAEIKAGNDVLIVGAGPIGLGAAAIAAADGANVAIADTSAERREHIKTQLKLPAFNPIDEKVENFFNGKLPLIVIDATGNQKAMNNDVNLIRHGGRIVFVGLFKGDFSIHDPDFHKRNHSFRKSQCHSEDFEKVQSLMAQGKLSASMMLTHTFKFDQLAEVFEEQVVNNKALIKSVVTYK